MTSGADERTGLPAAEGVDLADVPGRLIVVEPPEYVAPPQPPPGRLPWSSTVSPWIELVVVVVCALGAALIFQAVLVKPYRIPSESMETTLMPGDRVLVARFWYRFYDVRRGDIVVFHPPGRGAEMLPYSHTVASDVTFIKRVIGLPGEWIGGYQTKVWICTARPPDLHRPGPACKALAEPYVTSKQDPFRFREVQTDHYFMMGDNRDNSDDSRVIGQIPASSVLGRAFTRYWPLQRVGWFD